MRPWQPGLDARDFLWAGGIEDTFVPQTRPGHRALDEYNLIGHYDHWRTDLALARDLGLRGLRWGIPWYRVEPQPGQFDWRWIDAVLPYLVGELGITPILDLMHYGCPHWLKDEFANPGYPAAVARYAAAVAERYGHLVQHYTPLNEPTMNAWMCGQRGMWPPYRRGDRGYVQIMLQLVRGIQATVRAIQVVQPSAYMVHVDVAGLTLPATPVDAALAERLHLRGLISYDLVSGQVGPDHPLYAWLLSCGAAPVELAKIADAAIPLDCLGLNFYPQWSTKVVGRNAVGRVSYRPTDKTGTGFAALLTAYAARYDAPILITETSARGADAVRAAWLRDSLAAVRSVRAVGVPVLGYTWFPITSMINWSYRYGSGPADAYRLELGMYRLDRTSPIRWQPTPLIDTWRILVADPDATVGPLGEPLHHAQAIQPILIAGD